MITPRTKLGAGFFTSFFLTIGSVGAQPAPAPAQLEAAAPLKSSDAPAVPSSPPGPVPTDPVAPSALPAEGAAPSVGTAIDAEKKSLLPCLDDVVGCKLDDFKTPISPAFGIIGVTPSQVERPQTPKDVAVALYNAYNGGAVSQNFALEVAPFWLVSHARLQYDEYVHRSPFKQLYYNATISVATTAVESLSATDIGFGARTSIVLNGGLGEAEQKVLMAQRVVGDWATYSLSACAQHPAEPPCPELKQKVGDSPNAEDAADKLDKAVTAYKAALLAQSGFRFSLAGALAYRSDDDHFEPKDFLRGAGRLNFGYSNDVWELTSMGRYTSVQTPNVHFLDFGGRVGGYGERVGVFLEGVYRIVGGDDAGIGNSGRVVGTFELKAIDQIWASVSYGKDNANETGKGAQFALFGLNFQVGERRVKR